MRSTPRSGQWQQASDQGESVRPRSTATATVRSITGVPKLPPGAAIGDPGRKGPGLGLPGPGLMPGGVPLRPAAGLAALHREVSPGVPVRVRGAGGCAVAPQPRHQHPARPPLVPVGALLRVVPPGGAAHCHATMVAISPRRSGNHLAPAFGRLAGAGSEVSGESFQGSAAALREYVRCPWTWARAVDPQAAIR
jgi:hypothetical protein